MTNAHILWSHLENVVDLCKVALDYIVHQDFPPLCDYVLEATDARKKRIQRRKMLTQEKWMIIILEPA
jgi:hypothetical protein